MVGSVRYTQYEEGIACAADGREAKACSCCRGVANRYSPTDVYLGAFAINAAKLLPLTRVARFAEEYRNVPTSEGIAAIVSQITAARGK